MQEWGGGRSESLGTAAASAHIVTAPDDIGVWGTGGMLIDRGNRIYGRTLYPSATLSTTNSRSITLGMNPILCGQEPVA
jgi:hypothetical protein